MTGKTDDSIMLAPMPAADENSIDSQAEADIEWLKGAITGIRNIRGEMNISDNKVIPVILRNGNENDKLAFE